MSEATDPAPRFGVLGPLRAWRGESAVDLGPVQQWVVLAVLLLQAGHPISRQRLISAVWGDVPPARSVNLIQRHVSRLRRVLGTGEARDAPCRLVWTDAGYLLTVPGGAVDLTVFHQELARARAARAAGDLREAAAALHAALALWRGPVCDGLSSPFLDAQRDRLAETRISVIEERADLDLALGPDISTPAVASLAGMAREQIRPALAELARAHLVTCQHRGPMTGEWLFSVAAFPETAPDRDGHFADEMARGLPHLGDHRKRPGISCSRYATWMSPRIWTPCWTPFPGMRWQ